MKTVEQIIFDKIRPETSVSDPDRNISSVDFSNLNSLMINPAFRPLGPNQTLIDKIKIFIKRVIRKITKFYVEPIALQQTSFNVEIVKTVEELNRQSQIIQFEYERRCKEFETSIALLKNENSQLRKEIASLQSGKAEGK